MVRALFVLGLLMLAVETRASSVRIIVSGTGQPYVDQFAPALTSLAPGNGFVATADLAGGSLSARAPHDSGTSLTLSEASVFFYDIDLTNAASTPITFGGPLYPLTLSVAATMSEVGTGNGDLSHRVEAGLGGELNGVSVPGSHLQVDYTTTWTGSTASRSPLNVVQDSATIGQATYDSVLATLALSAITLNPGDHFNLHAFLSVDTSMTTSFSYGPSGVTDAAATPAQLRLRLPLGASLTNNAGVQLSWIVVPEPSLAVLSVLALALGLLSRKRFG